MKKYEVIIKECNDRELDRVVASVQKDLNTKRDFTLAECIIAKHFAECKKAIENDVIKLTCNFDTNDLCVVYVNNHDARIKCYYHKTFIDISMSCKEKYTSIILSSDIADKYKCNLKANKTLDIKHIAFDNIVDVVNTIIAITTL